MLFRGCGAGVFGAGVRRRVEVGDVRCVGVVGAGVEDEAEVRVEGVVGWCRRMGPVVGPRVEDVGPELFPVPLPVNLVPRCWVIGGLTAEEVDPMNLFTLPSPLSMAPSLIPKIPVSLHMCGPVINHLHLAIMCAYGCG